MDGTWYKKKSILILVALVVLSVVVVWVYVYQHRDRRIYCLESPAIETVESIAVEQDTEGVTYTDTENIKNLLKVIYGVKMITKKESIQDSPINVRDEMAIHISLSDERIITLFAYEKNFKYFIEMPYNGIYDIDEGVYTTLQEYLK